MTGVVASLDGAAHLACALVDALDALVTNGTLAIRGSDPGSMDTASRRAIVAESLRQGLDWLAATAFLVA